MSSHDWLPDRNPESSGGAGSSAPRPCVLVPPLVIGRDLRANAAGWTDPTPGGVFECKACGKQLRAELSGLLIFPLFKADTDLFRFTYVMPPHRTGGTFSVEICRGSETSVTREVERPTAVKFLARDQAPPWPGGGPAPQQDQAEAESRVSEDELRKKLDTLSPQVAEERYN